MASTTAALPAAFLLDLILLFDLRFAGWSVLRFPCESDSVRRASYRTMWANSIIYLINPHTSGCAELVMIIERPPLHEGLKVQQKYPGSDEGHLSWLAGYLQKYRRWLAGRLERTMSEIRGRPLSKFRFPDSKRNETKCALTCRRSYVETLVIAVRSSAENLNPRMPSNIFCPSALW